MLFDTLATAMANGTDSITWKMYNGETKTTLSANNGNDSYTTNYVYIDKLTITATYVDAYDVTYNANGGTGAPAAQKKIQGTALTLSTTKPTKASTSSTSTSTITVSYNANGGSSTPTAGTGTKTTVTTTPYSFSTWNTAANGSGTSYASGASYTTDAALTLYAQYTAGTPSSTTTNPKIPIAAAITRASGNVTGYKVTFNANGGSSTPNSVTSQRGATYSFKNWNSKSDGSGTTYSPGTSYSFSSNTTLYAMWSASYTNKAVTLASAISRANASAGSYTVTYNANGGSCSTTSASAARTTSYSFAGWNTKSDGSGTNYSAGASYTPSAAITLYAKWSSSTSTAPVTLPTPTRTGYTFKGWSTSSSATSGSTGSYTPTGNVTLYATWTINQYTITINNSSYGTVKNGSTTISSGNKVNYNTVLTITPTAATGYTTTASSSTGTISNNQLTVNENETITFTRAANTYTVEYKQGLASSDTNLPAKQNRTYPNAVTLASNSMSKSNTTQSGYKVTYANGTATGGTLPAAQTATDTKKYTANGWTTSSTNTDDPDYANGASFGSNSTTNLVLYPNFTTSLTRGSVPLATNSMTKSTVTNANYTVTLNANSGSVSPTSLSTSNTTKYTANGWTTTSGSTSRTHSNGASHQVTANLTLYPCFTQTTSTAAVTLPTPTRSGYTFKGWATSSSATSGVTGSYTPSGNVTLYATWSQNVSITTQPANATVMVGANISVSVTAVGDGLTYQWYYKNAGTSSFNESSIVTNTYTTTMNQDARIGRQVYCKITDANGNSVNSNTVTLSAIYQVIYDANNGSGTMSNSTHDYRTAKALTTNAFTRTGYSFLGWSTSPTATTATYTDGQSVSKLTYNSPTITLYAIWSQAQAFLQRYQTATNLEKVRVWYRTATEFVPIKKVWYYDGTQWVDITENNCKNWVRYSTDSDGVTIYNGGLGYKNGYRVRSAGAEGENANTSCTGFIKVNPGDIIRISGCNFGYSQNGNAINVSNGNFTNMGQFTMLPAQYDIFDGTYAAYSHQSVVEEKTGIWKWVVPPAERTR